MRKASTRLLEQGTQTPSPAPDLIPAETSTENLHRDWYSKRGHFRLQAVDKAAEIQPDVVVLDITMPHLDGFEAARRIRRVAPSAEILFLSQLDATETIRQAFSCGARGYVVKSDAAKELVAAVRAVGEKRQYLNARFAALL
jgi:DNA-binding NarL/FixJ family response regulator